jgi:hypothetical protein
MMKKNVCNVHFSVKQIVVSSQPMCVSAVCSDQGEKYGRVFWAVSPVTRGGKDLKWIEGESQAKKKEKHKTKTAMCMLVHV